MPSNASNELLMDNSPAAFRTSTALAGVAALVLLGNCLLSSYGSFSEKHNADTTILKPIVEALSLGGKTPTVRGVEIRNLFFYLGAAVLALVAAIRLTLTHLQPVASIDPFDIRRRAASPYFWWLLLLLISLLSSTFSPTPELCKGQTIIRFLQLAWWWPLAALLVPRHVGRLAGAMVASLALSAALGLWYHAQRDPHGVPLWYPFGNSPGMGASLLPGIFVALGLLAGQRHGKSQTDFLSSVESALPPIPCEIRRSRPGLPFFATLILALGTMAFALWLTDSRPAAGGFIAGIIALVFFRSSGKTRRLALLFGLLIAIAGVFHLQTLRDQAGPQGNSVRMQLDYGWRYALKLFTEKPFTGHGDGAYPLRAGLFAREEQMEAPRAISFDEYGWLSRPDNEYLQLLTELGLTGLLAFVVALALTIRRTLQYCDRTRNDPAEMRQRWLVVGLGAALVAMAVEALGSRALREPGLPPVFLTVWAALWALVRSRSQESMPVESNQLSNTAIRLSGVVAGVGAVFLGYFSLQDWQGTRNFYEARSFLLTQKPHAAIPLADRAFEQRLDLFQRLLAWRLMVETRSIRFTQMLIESSDQPVDRDLVLAQEALARLSQLEYVAPRFPGNSQWRTDLEWNLAQAYDRRGQRDLERERIKQALAAMLDYRADEPFNPRIVGRLWDAFFFIGTNWQSLGGQPDELCDVLDNKTARLTCTEYLRNLISSRDDIQHFFSQKAEIIHRLEWLLSLLRYGEAPPQLRGWYVDLQSFPLFALFMQERLEVAFRDSEQPSQPWQDRLAPETIRLAAFYLSLTGNPALAEKYLSAAGVLYQKAGPRLYTAQGAAIGEQVGYAFAANPLSDPALHLNRLAQASTLLERPAAPSDPLLGELGRTRLRILLAAEYEAEAMAQLDTLVGQALPTATLPPTGSAPTQPSRRDQELAAAFVDVAKALSGQPSEAAKAIRWAHRAAELIPNSPDAYGVLTALHLEQQNDHEAQAAATRFLETVAEPDRPRALNYLSILESRYPARPLWEILRRTQTDFPPPPMVGPPEPEPPPNQATTTSPTE